MTTAQSFYKRQVSILGVSRKEDDKGRLSPTNNPLSKLLSASSPIAGSGTGGGPSVHQSATNNQAAQVNPNAPTQGNPAPFDDSDDQINSLEFMTRTIMRLETKLEEIESIVTDVEQTLAVQDEQIKYRVNMYQVDIKQFYDSEDSIVS